MNNEIDSHSAGIPWPTEFRKKKSACNADTVCPLWDNFVNEKFPLFTDSLQRPTAKQFLGHPRNLQHPLVSSLNPEGVYVWACAAHPPCPAMALLSDMPGGSSALLVEVPAWCPLVNRPCFNKACYCVTPYLAGIIQGCKKKNISIRPAWIAAVRIMIFKYLCMQSLCRIGNVLSA